MAKFVEVHCSGENMMLNSEPPRAVSKWNRGGCTMAREYCILRGDVVLCRNSLPYCGYPVKLLRQMIADGHRYTVDGKERKV